MSRFYGNDEAAYQGLTVTGLLVHHSSVQELTNLSGLIVLFDSESAIFEPSIRSFQNRRASAVVIGFVKNEVAGQVMYVVDGKGYKDLTIPVVQVEKDEYFEQLKPLVLAKGNVSGLVTFSEQNPWKSFNESGFMIFWAVVIGCCSFACAAESIRRMYLLISNNAFKKYFALICLLFEVIANVLRVIYCIDPLRTFRIFSYSASGFLLLAPYYFSLVPTVLLVFYLHDMAISAKIHVTEFLEKLRIPFILVMGIVTVITIVTLAFTLLNIYASVSGTVIALSIYIVNFSLAFYFSVVCYKIIQVIKMASKMNSRLKRVTSRILVAVGGIFAQLFSSMYVGSAKATPIPYKVVFLFVMIFSLIISFAQILAFIPSKKKSSTSGSSAKTTKETEKVAE